MLCIHPEINMEPKNEGFTILEDDFPLELGVFLGSSW